VICSARRESEPEGKRFVDVGGGSVVWMALGCVGGRLSLCDEDTTQIPYLLGGSLLQTGRGGRYPRRFLINRMHKPLALRGVSIFLPVSSQGRQYRSRKEVGPEKWFSNHDISTIQYEQSFMNFHRQTAEQERECDQNREIRRPRIKSRRLEEAVTLCSADSNSETSGSSDVDADSVECQCE
jgi:hypothetical protein